MKPIIITFAVFVLFSCGNNKELENLKKEKDVINGIKKYKKIYKILDGADWFHTTGITPALSDKAAACKSLTRFLATSLGFP
jgi:uncharacterized protein (DUF169 family)